MKDFPNIPFHDEIAEKLFVRNREEVGLFEVRINNNSFYENDLHRKNKGDLATIKANNYPDQDYKRVFMYLDNRCPTWPEMVELANMFFKPGEVAIQFHPKASEYVNDNKTALHLWEPKVPEQLELIHHASRVCRAATAKLRNSKKQGIIRGAENWKHFIALSCGDKWPSWQEVCDIKNEYFGKDRSAFQLNISKEFDLHPCKILTLWDTEEFGIKLPPSEIV